MTKNLPYALTWLGGVLLVFNQESMMTWTFFWGLALTLYAGWFLFKDSRDQKPFQMTASQAGVFLSWHAGLLMGVGRSVDGWSLFLGGLVMTAITIYYIQNFANEKEPQ